MDAIVKHHVICNLHNGLAPVSRTLSSRLIGRPETNKATSIRAKPTCCGPDRGRQRRNRDDSSRGSDEQTYFVPARRGLTSDDFVGGFRKDRFRLDYDDSTRCSDFSWTNDL